MATINNPGNGDCGFYAFAIGLIDIIQKEHKKDGSSTTFNNWSQQDESIKKLYHEITNFDLVALGKNSHYNSNVLEQLQMSLRKVSHNEYLAEVNNTDQISSTILYSDFQEFVLAYVKTTDKNGKFHSNFRHPSSQATEDLKCNLFNNSRSMKELAIGAAKTLIDRFNNPLENDEHKNKLHNNTFRVKNVLQDKVLESIFKNNLSTISQGLQQIKNNGVWASHKDLRMVASKLQVNLAVTGKANTCDRELNPNIPTVRLLNSSNAHWMTEIALPRSTNASLNTKKNTAHRTTEIELVSRTTKEASKNTKNNEDTTTATKPITSNKEAKQELSSPKKHVLDTTLSSVQKNGSQYKKYSSILKDLLLNLSLFNKNIGTSSIDLDNIDKATASKGETDQDFAERLQVAEFKHTKLM